MPNSIHFTDRELFVWEGAARSQPNKEIAARLGRSKKTIEKHRQTLYLKLNVHDTAALVRAAYDHGILKINALS